VARWPLWRRAIQRAATARAAERAAARALAPRGARGADAARGARRAAQARLAVRRTEAGRAAERLAALAGVRPAHQGELERLQAQLGALFTAYLQRCGPGAAAADEHPAGAGVHAWTGQKHGMASI